MQAIVRELAADGGTNHTTPARHQRASHLNSQS
jgi:hypothetical protein